MPHVIHEYQYQRATTQLQSLSKISARTYWVLVDPAISVPYHSRTVSQYFTDIVCINIIGYYWNVKCELSPTQIYSDQ